MKLLIDTNVLLEFYRNQQHKLATLDDLGRLGTAILFPEQIIREFRRNRSDRIDEYPYLKDEDIEFAPVYTRAYPRMGRPRPMSPEAAPK